MQPTQDPMMQNLTERLCWQAARRDDSRLARRLDRTQGVDGGYRLDAGAWLDACCHCRQELGVLERMTHVQGPAVQRARGCPAGRMSCSMP
jgi:hypothetical protein